MSTEKNSKRNQKLEQLQSLNHQQLVTRHRQLTRKITRDSLGSVISSSLALFMPWHLFSSGLNITLLYRHIKEFSTLQKYLASIGIKVRKRIIVQGLVEGAAVKMGTTFLLFGHDDLGVVANATDPWLDRTGDWIANQTGTVIEAPSMQGLVLDDEIHRDGHKIVHVASSVASLPTELVQEYMGLQTADDVAETHKTGWHADSAQVAAQVVVAGSMQAGSEKVLDTVLERPIDTRVDSRMERVEFERQSIMRARTGRSYK